MSEPGITPGKLRLFVGVHIPSQVLTQLDDRVAPLRAKLVNARWTPVENQHLTLKFLGSMPEDRVESVSQTCAMVAAGRRRGTLGFTDLGAFPSRTRVRVLWMGIEDHDNVLSPTAADLDGAFESLGFASEGRAYKPHLTLARFKLPVPLKSGFPEIDTAGIPSFEVTDIALFRSYLSAKGARYEVMDTFHLGSNA